MFLIAPIIHSAPLHIKWDSPDIQILILLFGLIRLWDRKESWVVPSGSPSKILCVVPKKFLQKGYKHLLCILKLYIDNMIEKKIHKEDNKVRALTDEDNDLLDASMNYNDKLLKRLAQM